MWRGPTINDIQFIKSIGGIPIPLHAKGKNPLMHNWTNPSRAAHFDFSKHLAAGGNIGMLLGAPSRDLVCVDLDSQNAINLAPAFDLRTGLVHGRVGAFGSHRYFYCDAKTSHGDSVDLLSTDAQVMVPGSIHPNGHRLFWERKHDPTKITSSVLEKSVSQLRAACILADSWREHQRQDLTLYFSRVALTRGWNVDQTCEFIGRVADGCGDDEFPKRIQAIENTAKKIAANEPTRGFPHLAQLLPDGAAVRLCKHLNFRIEPAANVYQKEGETAMELFLASTLAKEIHPGDLFVLREFLTKGGFENPIPFSPKSVRCKMASRTFRDITERLKSKQLITVTRRCLRKTNIWQKGPQLESLLNADHNINPSTPDPENKQTRTN